MVNLQRLSVGATISSENTFLTDLTDSKKLPRRDSLLMMVPPVAVMSSAHAEGAPGPAFGNAGVALGGVSNAGGYVRGLAAQPGGKIVIRDRGNSSNTRRAHLFVDRFNTTVARVRVLICRSLHLWLAGL